MPGLAPLDAVKPHSTCANYVLRSIAIYTCEGPVMSYNHDTYISVSMRCGGYIHT